MKRHTASVLLVVGLLVVACGDSDDDTTTTAAPEGSAADATITIADFTFDAPTTVAVGDTVEVVNEDTVGHTWTAAGGEFDSGTLATGATFDHTFEEAGEFDYFCSIHPDMTGTITVEG
jgi:plastocyanin